MSRKRNVILLVILILSATIGGKIAWYRAFPSTHSIQSDFVQWSNGLPEDDATEQLKVFLSKFQNSAEARQWLTETGFQVDQVRLIDEHSAQILGINSAPAYSLVAGWNVKKNGPIFQHGWTQILSMGSAYGVALEIVFTPEFSVHDIKVTRSYL